MYVVQVIAPTDDPRAYSRYCTVAYTRFYRVALRAWLSCLENPVPGYPIVQLSYEEES